jgi:pimeloyl-ACP methyl ester carboxylesterase
VSSADEAGAVPTWLRDVPGPVVLVGHSLGGRIALRVAETGAVDLRAVVCLAPAVAASSLRADGLVSFARQARLAVVHSAEDQVLSVLFRLGEGTSEHAVGYAGAPASWTGVRNQRVDCGHLDYAARAEALVARLTR